MIARLRSDALQRRWKSLSDANSDRICFLAKSLVRFRDEFAVRAEELDPLGENADRHAAEVDLARSVVGLEVFAVFLGAIPFRVGRSGIVVVIGLVNDDRFAVEVRVVEQRRRLLEIHDGEKELAVGLIDARAAANRLLEGGHRIDCLVEHDQFASLGVDAGRHQFGGRRDHRKAALRVDEVVELRLAIGAVAGDSHYIFRVIDCDLSRRVHEGRPHPFGMIDVLAKDDGLGEGIGYVEIFHDPLCDELGPLLQDQLSLHVFLIVFALRHRPTVVVDHAGRGGPALDILVDVDADYPVGREKAVLDPLLQRIGVHRISEVIDVRDVFRLLRRRGHADLNRAREIIENFAPLRVVGGAAAMALVDHDQVEELGRERLERLVGLLAAGDRLIEREMDFVGRIECVSVTLVRAGPNGLKSLFIA